MKTKILYLSLIFSFLPLCGRAQASEPGRPSGITLRSGSDSAVLAWTNPADPLFSETVLFRSSIPIEEYFSYEAVDGLCDKIYEGNDEAYMDEGLAANLPYYYIFFAKYGNGSTSRAAIIRKDPENGSGKPANIDLSEMSSGVVNSVSLSEAGMLYNFNTPVNMDDNSRRLSLFIIVRSPNFLSEKDKNAISYFIHAGTPTTLLLGSGERAGVLNSYMSVFDKLPTSELEWQDVIKIGNGRWPGERSLLSEKTAADTFFSAVYKRQPDMDDPNDNAAVTVIAYGLRPARRNLESEKNAILIFKDIFGKNPIEASDWDIVRAIAYSGATR